MLNPMKNDHWQQTVQQEIDESLRKVYERALQAEIPERFHELLARLRDAEAGDRQE